MLACCAFVVVVVYRCCVRVVFVGCGCAVLVSGLIVVVVAFGVVVARRCVCLCCVRCVFAVVARYCLACVELCC